MAMTRSTVPSSSLVQPVMLLTPTSSRQFSVSLSGSMRSAIRLASACSSPSWPLSPGISLRTPTLSTPRSSMVFTSGVDMSCVSVPPMMTSSSITKRPAPSAMALRQGLPSSPMRVNFTLLKFSCSRLNLRLSFLSRPFFMFIIIAPAAPS